MEEAIEGEVHLGPQDVDIAPIHGHLHQSGMIQETGIVEEEIITHHHALGLFHDLYLPVMISTSGLIITQRVQGRMIRVPAATGTVDQIRGHSVQ